MSSSNLPLQPWFLLNVGCAAVQTTPSRHRLYPQPTARFTLPSPHPPPPTRSMSGVTHLGNGCILLIYRKLDKWFSKKWEDLETCLLPRTEVRASPFLSLLWKMHAYMSAYMYECTYIWMHVCMNACMYDLYMFVYGYTVAPSWRWVDNLWQSVLSLYHVSPGEQTPVIRMGG